MKRLLSLFAFWFVIFPNSNGGKALQVGPFFDKQSCTAISQYVNDNDHGYFMATPCWSDGK